MCFGGTDGWQRHQDYDPRPSWTSGTLACELRETMTQYQGILLLGPTGSGKTPLGDQIAERGLGNRRLCHFDFGANLRRAARGETPEGVFLDSERAFLQSVLESGALLENDRFGLAERILKRFLEDRCRDGRREVVLNGLPRHVGQAEAVGEFVHVHSVVTLECTDNVVFARIASNVGGDRAHRNDDGLEDIRRKLAVYAKRTSPLVEHYRNRGASVVSIPVTAETTPDSAYRAVADRLADC